jgi:hypothetical protein
MITESLLHFSEDERLFFNSILINVRTGNLSVEYNGSLKDAALLTKIFFGEHPELFYIDNCNISASSSMLSKKIIFHTLLKKYELDAYKKIFDQECRKILNKIIFCNKNDAQKILAVHDYFIKNVSYDVCGEKRFSHCAYGAIVEKCAVCEGIACAFSHLMHLINIKCSIVNGIADGQPHCWNIVELCGCSYIVDVTWDLQKNENYFSYDYFCIKDSDVCNRTIYNKNFYPVCNNNRYNYFNVMRCLAHSDVDFINSARSQIIKQGYLYIRQDFIKFRNEDQAIDYFYNLLKSDRKLSDYLLGSTVCNYNITMNTFKLHKVRR